MLAVFEKEVSRPPQELSLPSIGYQSSKNCKEIAEGFQLSWPGSILYNIANENYMALSDDDSSPPQHPRSVIVLDDIFCIFTGSLENTGELRRHYGLSREAKDVMIVVEAYKVLRDRAPYPPDQVIKDLQGRFAFILFDAKHGALFAARDRDGHVELQWGMAGDGSLIFSDDSKFIAEACGKSIAPFPAGCIFLNRRGLISFDYPLHKVRANALEDDDGNICSVMFQVDLYSRLNSIPRTGSAANWAGVMIEIEGE
ncbi:hypothetical protein Ancab_033826 [Ancistrocladus abbreviatus]